MPEDFADSFTLTDRKELLRQGLQLEAICEDLTDLKVLFNASLEKFEKKADSDSTQKSIEIGDLKQKVRILEDTKLRLETKMNTFLWFASMIGAVVGTLVHIALHLYSK